MEFKAGIKELKGLFFPAVHTRPTQEQLMDEWIEVNKELVEEDFGGMIFNRQRAYQAIRDIRSVHSQFYGIEEGPLGDTIATAAAFQIETIRAQADKEYQEQSSAYSHRAVDSRILAAMNLAEDALDMEGDVFSAVMSPIELGMDARVWVQGRDASMVKDINDRLRAWNVIETINHAWQDMETYSAFYISHAWDEGVPNPIHWSPKRIAVGPFETGFGWWDTSFLPTETGRTMLTQETGDESQTMMEFFKSVTGKEWNDWEQGHEGARLKEEYLTQYHLLKARHKRYPYPWLAKAATPIYTRQIIEEMRLGLVMGVMNQLWVMTLQDPQPKEIGALKSLLASNRAERTGFLLWRGGLEVNTYTNEAIEQLLLPEAWWAATLDIFRRIGRTIRIVSGESAQRSGMGSSDAEIDVRIAQNKAMSHRAVVANHVVLDLLRQWKEGGAAEAVDKGEISVHLSPIQLFLGEELTNIWGPMWDRGIASIHTIHDALGIDTAYETEMMEQEEKDGLDEVYIARQQFAQRVATPQGDVTRSSEPGRPEGQEVQAAMSDIDEQVLTAFDQIDEGKDDDERRRRVTAFIALLTALVAAHMRGAYLEGYDRSGGGRTLSKERLQAGIDWENDHIAGLESDMMLAIEGGRDMGHLRWRVELHPRASWKRGYMDGVFQAKDEDGWRFWQRVLRPDKSKSGPCEICIADSVVWHPISEPFWDHPYGVCDQQFVKFMQTSTDGWDSISRERVTVPLVWKEG